MNDGCMCNCCSTGDVASNASRSYQRNVAPAHTYPAKKWLRAPATLPATLPICMSAPQDRRDRVTRSLSLGTTPVTEDTGLGRATALQRAALLAPARAIPITDGNQSSDEESEIAGLLGGTPTKISAVHASFQHRTRVECTPRCAAPVHPRSSLSLANQLEDGLWLLWPQPILKRSGGARAAKEEKGSPQWRSVIKFTRDPMEPPPASWKSCDAKTLAAIKGCESDGGGFTAAGPRTGVYSVPKNTYTYALKCCSRAAWGCQNELRIVVDMTCHTEEILDSEGWPHRHEGTMQLTRGLPHQVSPLSLSTPYSDCWGLSEASRESFRCGPLSALSTNSFRHTCCPFVFYGLGISLSFHKEPGHRKLSTPGR
jgi:hypothetical protein